MGTRGYAAPEYVATGLIQLCINCYWCFILLLGFMVTGLKSFDVHFIMVLHSSFQQESSNNLINSLVLSHWCSGSVGLMIFLLNSNPYVLVKATKSVPQLLDSLCLLCCTAP